MGGAMSLIAIGWDGYNKMKKNQLTMAMGQAQKFSTYLEMGRLLMI